MANLDITNFTDEQKKAFGTAYSLGDKNFGVQGLSSSDFTAPSLDFKTPQTTEPFPVQNIPVPELAATEPEKQADDITKRLQSLNEKLVGQSAFRTEQERTHIDCSRRQRGPRLQTYPTGLRDDAQRHARRPVPEPRQGVRRDPQLDSG